MAQQLMWDYQSSVFRGQAVNGTVVTVTEDAMNMAQRKAGKSVYETDWWLETLDTVLDGWGIEIKRWHDYVTAQNRADYTLRPGTDTGNLLPW